MQATWKTPNPYEPEVSGKRIYTREQLKHRRMLIRAGIGCVLRTIEERELLEMCIYRDRDAFNEWFDWYCGHKEHDVFMRELRKLAVDMGIKHWRLRGVAGGALEAPLGFRNPKGTPAGAMTNPAP